MVAVGENSSGSKKLLVEVSLVSVLSCPFAVGSSILVRLSWLHHKLWLLVAYVYCVVPGGFLVSCCSCRGTL